MNALQTLNIRGERSVTCKGDSRPGALDGPLAAGARQPCARNSASSRTRSSAPPNSTPSTAGIPILRNCRMYCIVFSFKDPYDTKDMRSTGGGDAHYDIDFPARDQTLVAQLRARRAPSSMPKSVEHGVQRSPSSSIRNGAPGTPGTNRPTKVLVSTLGYQRSTWAGNPSEVYDTTRAASLRFKLRFGRLRKRESCDLQPVRRNRACLAAGPPITIPVALILPQKSLISYTRRRDRRQHLPRSRGHSCAARSRTPTKVLDALKDPVNGYYDPRDIFTTLPQIELFWISLTSDSIATGERGSLPRNAHRDHPRIDADFSGRKSR